MSQYVVVREFDRSYTVHDNLIDPHSPNGYRKSVNVTADDLRRYAERHPEYAEVVARLVGEAPS